MRQQQQEQKKTRTRIHFVNFKRRASRERRRSRARACVSECRLSCTSRARLCQYYVRFVQSACARVRDPTEVYVAAAAAAAAASQSRSGKMENTNFSRVDRRASGTMAHMNRVAGMLCYRLRGAGGDQQEMNMHILSISINLHICNMPSIAWTNLFTKRGP